MRPEVQVWNARLFMCCSRPPLKGTLLSLRLFPYSLNGQKIVSGSQMKHAGVGMPTLQCCTAGHLEGQALVAVNLLLLS